MKPEFYKIKHADLAEYSNSEAYQKLTEKPVSVERIESYLKNPNALPADYILYVLYSDNQLIAYRSLLPDNYYDKSKTHFAWLSGNWVHPEHRGKGFSSSLLHEAVSDWGNKLMYTNYAPESHALYQKSGLFHLISSRTGSRFYLFAKTQKLLIHRVNKTMHVFLPILDFFVAIYTHLKIKISSKTKLNTDNITVLQQPDNNFLEAFNRRKKEGFHRTDSELIWILKYPWVSNAKNNQTYFFSHYAKAMFYQFLWIKNDNGKNTGWAILHFRDGVLKIPYYHAEDAELACLAQYVIHFAKTQKIEQFRCFDTDLVAAVNESKNPFIYQKQAKQNVYAAWDTNPREPIVKDGDGDYIFT